MYSTVIVIQCLFLFHAAMTDSTIDLLKLSVSNQVLVLNSHIKDLKALVEHQNTKLEHQNTQFAELKTLVEHQNTQFAKENLKFSEENAKLAKLETKIGNLESEIARLTHSEVTTTKPLLTTTSSPTTSTTKTTPLTTMGPTEPSTTTPFSVGIKDQALLLHIKDQDIKIADLKTLIEHQNTQFAELKTLVEHQNTQFAKENLKFLEENAKLAKVESKIGNLESEIARLTHSEVTTTKPLLTTTSSTPTTTTTSTTMGPTMRPTIPTTTTSSPQTGTSSGVVFTRWGRRDCPASISTPVYNGTVGGSHYGHTGAAVNRLCMPNQPTWDNNKLYKLKYNYNGYVYSGVYSIGLPDSSLSGHFAPCAVCRAELFSTKVMIPGRDTCFPGWSKAYSGELVSGPYDYKAATEYTCLDRQPQKAGSGGNIGLYLVSVLAKCGFPYQDGALLTCVVCLK